VKASFPRAVILDRSKNHHYTIWVYRARGKVAMHCLECGDRGEVGIKDLDWLRTLISNDDDVQVIGWIDDDGE
jgi:hypothetical protein